METLDVATATGTSFSAADSGRSAIVDAASAVGAMQAEEAASETASPAEECCYVA